jgi:hypothetical protein
MNRVLSALLLIVLALPYARTPICSSSGHEHEGHDRSVAALAAHDGHGSDASDCHSLMACDTSIQGITVPTAPAVKAVTGILARANSVAPGYEGPARTPIPPPPQAV